MDLPELQADWHLCYNTFMTLEEAYEYIDTSHEAEGEQRGEFGMGAVSMGYDPYDAMSCYDGYRTAGDPTYAEAQRIVSAHEAQERAMVKADTAGFRYDTDDLPF